MDSLIINSFTASPFTPLEQLDIPNPYRMAKIVANARIELGEIHLGASFGGDLMGNFAWGMKAGANAFNVVVRTAREEAALLGSELQRINQFWADYYGTRN